MKEKTEIVKKELSLEYLPHRGKLINWKELVGKFVHFLYGDIEGFIEIVEYYIEENKIKTRYKDIEYITTTSNFQKIKISNCLGIKRKNSKKVGFEYNVGDIITTNNGKIKIIKQIRVGEKNIRSYEYKCLIDGDIDTIREYDLIKGCGCKVCSNHKVVKGINDIATTHPYLVKYFKNIEDTYTHSYGSKDNFIFKCPDCGCEKEMIIVFFIKQNYCCPKCSDGISVAQKIMFNIFEQLNVDFITEYNPDWIKPRRYDFYFKIQDKKYILETDGGWHIKDNNRSGQTKEKSKSIDDYKDEQAVLNGIEKPIRIDCNYGSKDRFEYIRQNILNSKKLNKLFDLSKIDWNKCFDFSLSSRIKEACEYKKNNPNMATGDISKIMKLSQSSITNFLKVGNEMGLCYYDTKEEIKKSGKINSKKVICLDDGLIFDSAREAGRFYKCHGNKVSAVCRGERQSTGERHFSYNNITK